MTSAQKVVFLAMRVIGIRIYHVSNTDTSLSSNDKDCDVVPIQENMIFYTLSPENYTESPYFMRGSSWIRFEYSFISGEHLKKSLIWQLTASELCIPLKRVIVLTTYFELLQRVSNCQRVLFIHKMFWWCRVTLNQTRGGA